MVVGDDDEMPIKRFIARPFEEIEHVFQSPGPIYEPGMTSHDWWRWDACVKSDGTWQR